jgi:hypothetical protein
MGYLLLARRPRRPRRLGGRRIVGGPAALLNLAFDLRVNRGFLLLGRQVVLFRDAWRRSRFRMLMALVWHIATIVP